MFNIEGAGCESGRSRLLGGRCCQRAQIIPCATSYPRTLTRRLYRWRRRAGAARRPPSRPPLNLHGRRRQREGKAAGLFRRLRRAGPGGVLCGHQLLAQEAAERRRARRFVSSHCPPGARLGAGTRSGCEARKMHSTNACCRSGSCAHASVTQPGLALAVAAELP